MPAKELLEALRLTPWSVNLFRGFNTVEERSNVGIDLLTALAHGQCVLFVFRYAVSTDNHAQWARGAELVAVGDNYDQAFKHALEDCPMIVDARRLTNDDIMVNFPPVPEIEIED